MRYPDKLAGVDDPEKKRMIIGNEFIEVFAEEARKLDGIEFLAQGTITWKFMDFGTADKKCQLSSKVLFHFHELCRLRLRKTRGGDLPGPGGRRKL